MRILILYISIFTIFIFSNSRIFSQNLINEGDLRVKFLKEKVEVNPGKTFFDVLYIENLTSHSIDFSVNFTLPVNWNLIGQLSENFQLQANSLLKIPVRVTVAGDVTGGVGYVIDASIRDANGVLYKTEYSYMAIPPVTNLQVFTGNKTSYFDNTNLDGTFTLKLKNNGNVSEKVQISALPDNTIIIPDAQNSIYIKELDLPPRKDTTITIKVRLNESDKYNKLMLHVININITGNDTIINKKVWFKYLDWQYVKIINENEQPLIIEASAQNIFGNTKATYRTKIFGQTLLNKNRTIYYNFEKWSIADEGDYFIKNTRLYAGYISPKFIINIGDYFGEMFDPNIYGRGVYSQIQLSKIQKVNFAVTQRVNSDIYNLGFSYKINLKKSIFFETGGVYSINEIYKSETYSIFERLSINIFKKNNINLRLKYAQKDYYINGINTAYKGYGYNFSFRTSIKGAKFIVKSFYGSPDFSDYSAGRLNINADLYSKFKSNKNWNVNYTKQRYQPVYFINDIRYNDKFSDYDLLRTIVGINLENNLYLFGGIILENKSSNNFATFEITSAFKTIAYKGELGISFRERNTINSLTIKARYGNVNVYEFSNILNGIYRPEIQRIKPFPIAEVSINLKRSFYGVNFLYFYGPINLNQELAYFYTSYFSKSLNIIPYFEKFIYKDKVKLDIRGTYINNLSSSDSRINLNTRIDIYANKGWSFYFLNSTSTQTVRSTGIRSGSNFYSSTYFEFGIRKVFQWNQPRLKYYDLNAVFYKDLNGNLKHDENEPGVGNVLVNIERKDPLADAANPNYNGEFSNIELLSNSKGTIRYKNIVNGDYIFNYAQTSSYKDNYSAEESKLNFSATNDTLIYIPFTEKNKVFGRVIMHRAPHSSLDNVPIDNIKITIEGNNKFYSVLTNKEGYFEAYLPVSDFYKVSVNNVFYENFDLRRDYYMVKFNGYKQFEVTFDFDEKKREIKFDQNDFVVNEADDFNIEDIKVIRQTNLKGVVRDGNSLNPMHSRIQIRNSVTNELIVEAASSSRTGEYFSTFFAGENYVMTVEAKGYWNYKEKLEIDQITAFDNITRDILLLKIFDGEKLQAENLNFDYGKSEISQIAKVQLDLIVKKLENNPDVKIEVKGFTDNVEAINFNAQQISDERAKAVANYLKSKGINSNRISEVGMKDKEPAYSNDSETGRFKNRRVEIHVVYKESGEQH